MVVMIGTMWMVEPAMIKSVVDLATIRFVVVPIVTHCAVVMGSISSFGDDGVDYLYGDAGILIGGLQVIENQRLFGGNEIDYLYAYSTSTTVPNAILEKDLIGDELHGGSGGDWLYGGLRKDKLYGDAGNDTLQGDAVMGSGYLPNSNRSVIGGADQLFGGTGEDKLYGGGSNDDLWGGPDSDWLEGQIGKRSDAWWKWHRSNRARHAE